VTGAHVGRIGAGVGLTLVLAQVLAVPPAAPAAGRSGCDLGWFVVDGAALLDESASSGGAITPQHTAGSRSIHGRVVSLVGDEVSIEGVCPRIPATTKHKRKRTKIRATWDGCAGIEGKVTLRASIDAADCGRMKGRVKGKRVEGKKARPQRQRFTATRALGNPDDCADEDTFLLIQQKIFGAKGCRLATCHGEFVSGGLDLRWGAAHFSLVDRPATTPGADGQMLVKPGDPDASFLWRKLAGRLDPDEGDRMPAAGAPPLDALELELVRAWIAGGSPAVGRLAEAPCLPHPQFEPAAPLAPPPGGHQIVLDGPILQPGEEMEGCMWVQAPNTEDFVVGKWEYSMNPGSHHFALWDHVRGPMPPLNEFAAGDTACIRNGAPIDGISISGAGEAPYFVDDYPAGAGNTIEAGKIIGLNPHYFNEFDVPIQVKIWINLHPVEGTHQREVETLFSGPGFFEGKSVFSIAVDPFSTGTLRLRMVNALGTPMHIFQMSSHQHQRGTRFTAWNAGGDKVFENFDWAHPAVLDFDAPYVLEPGDHLDYECEWDNGVNRPVRRCGDSQYDAGCTEGEPARLGFGVTAQDEMCYLTGFYYTE
jgi:hypothetical protein